MPGNPHALDELVYEETDEQVTFHCVSCQAKIGFAKPGSGSPEAVFDDACLRWKWPENYMEWMDPCPHA